MPPRFRWPAHPPREPRLRRWAADLRADLHYALRQLRRAPGVAALVVGTLAVGIGANVSMAGVIDRLLLRGPPGVHEPERLVRLLSVVPGAPAPGAYTSYPQLLDYRREVAAFADVAAHVGARLPLGEGPEAPELAAALVSASYFPLLGARPALGRFFGARDGFPDGTAAGGPPLAVLSHGAWQRHFGGDPGVVGRAVRVGKLTYTVVGVAPPGFQGVEAEMPDVWLPLTVTADVELRRFALEDRGMSWLTTVARLRDGATRAEAEAQATPVLRREAGDLPIYAGMRAVAASVIRGRGPDRPREVKVALWLGGVSALVLLIACANVANLLLARAWVRRREIAVRLALGAGRGRLARQLLAEAGLLAALGAAGAVGLAAAGSGVLRHLFDADVAAGGFVDARLLGFTAVVALGTTVLVSLAPLLLAALPDLTRLLKAGAATGGGRTSQARMALLGAQAAMCVLLLVVAGLFAQSLRRVTGLDLGLRPERTLVAHFSLDNALMTNDERDATYALLRERVRAVPGVARAAFAYEGGRAVSVHTRTRDAEEHLQRTWSAPYEIPVDSGYFRALGSTLHGRDFTSADVRGAPKVAIVNAPLAELLFPDGDALGQCIYLPMRGDGPSGDCFTVVGVLQGYWYLHGILRRDGLLVYVPLAQRSYGLGRPGKMAITIDGSPAAVIPAVRHAILSVRPDLPRVRIQWLRDVVEPELRPWRLAAAMFSLFGAVALVVATVGLYAVVSFAAAQRASEIAVRLALGARGRDVLAVVAGDGLRAVVAGLAVGVAGALVARRWIGPLLFQTSPSDPAVILGVAGLLLGVAALAIVVPTVRSMRASPAAVLRVD